MDKLIVLNAGSQLSIKLDGDNYPAWRIQFSALLTGFNLFGYVDGSNLCLPKHKWLRAVQPQILPIPVGSARIH